MHLLFDLDGTLTDSREGIVRCINHAILELGADAPPVESLTRRRRFERLGMFENALYPGSAEALNSSPQPGSVFTS
ncbi:MAG: HAD hydrolase-like protein [Vicinamibacterales bacterium]